MFWKLFWEKVALEVRIKIDRMLSEFIISRLELLAEIAEKSST